MLSYSYQELLIRVIFCEGFMKILICDDEYTNLEILKNILLNIQQLIA